MFFRFVRLWSEVFDESSQMHIQPSLKPLPHPICEFFRVRDSCRQENYVYMIWKHDNDLFPNDTTLHTIREQMNHISSLSQIQRADSVEWLFTSLSFT
jgi:hypothetical protein